MALMKRISGIRGTIGGFLGTGLTPYDIVVFASGYAQYVLEKHGKGSIVVGRDARISGEMVSSLVVRTLQGMGLDVVDLGFLGGRSPDPFRLERLSFRPASRR